MAASFDFFLARSFMTISRSSIVHDFVLLCFVPLSLVSHRSFSCFLCFLKMYLHLVSFQSFGVYFYRSVFYACLTFKKISLTVQHARRWVLALTYHHINFFASSSRIFFILFFQKLSNLFFTSSIFDSLTPCSFILLSLL